MRQYTKRLYKFGGLNELASNFNLKDHESPEVINVILTEYGAAQKRPGYTTVADIGANRITGLYNYHKKDTTSFFLTTSGSSLYKFDKASGTVTELLAGLTADKYPSFTTLGDICYMVNGFDNLKMFDGVSVTENINAPHGKYIVDHYNILFMAGEPDNPSRLYYNETYLDTIDTWHKVDEMSEDDGDIITNITSLHGDLIIFKTNSIWVLYGTNPDNWVLRKVQDNIGCVAPRSVVNIHGQLYFLGINGVYKFDGMNVQLISGKVKKTIKSILNLEDCVAGWYDHNYMLEYPSPDSLTNNKTLVYNLIHEEWTKFEGLNVSIFGNFDGSQDGLTNGNELYFGDSNTGKVYQYDTSLSDNGAEIELIYKTKRFTLDKPEKVKDFRNILIDTMSEGAVDLFYSIDGGYKEGSFEVLGYDPNPSYLWGENTWGSGEWHAKRKTQFGKSLPDIMIGSDIQFIFKEKSTKRCTIYGLTVKSRERREFYA